MKHLIIISAIIMLLSPAIQADPEDGYRLWLRYNLIADPEVLNTYNSAISGCMIIGDSPVIKTAERELYNGLTGLLGRSVPSVKKIKSDGIVIAGTPAGSRIIARLGLDKELEKLGDEGYLISAVKLKRKSVIVIASSTDAGVLYGTFRFLRLLQTHSDISSISVSDSPKVGRRLLNHWDNLDGSIERGYAGQSLWEWDSLPGKVSGRYSDYARANASVGINGTVLTNVNANAMILTPGYLAKVAAIADVLRLYNIKVYLTARFSAPVETGSLETADPLDPAVSAWWKAKVEEIYKYIPDFGGFLVKANSEGQPGPQNYGRSHADGANMLADAVAPFKGIVMWRAFVYDDKVPDDRAKQAYNEFIPLDGKFRENVIIQVKNGPVDFQPREPFHPIFGAMPSTNLMPELQITQEYLGSSVHLVYLAPLFEECLKSDTRARGKGSLVARVTDGTLENRSLTAIAGVANTGNTVNWTGHPFGQANWYAFGRLAWDPYAASPEIAEEWIRMTFSNDPAVTASIMKIMLGSREAAVSYMTPLGLHHIMYAGHHYGPGPWVDRGRRDWTSVYYHNAGPDGIGFNRTSSGSNAVGQYYPEVQRMFEDPGNCPENLLLWFHHLPWDYRMRSGRSLWEELCFKYHDGVDQVRQMKEGWKKTEGKIDAGRFDEVSSLLGKQERDARIWRDGCLLYFREFSGKPFPDGLENPEHDLDFYKRHRYNDIPGIR